MTNLAPRRLLLALAASIQLGAAPTPVVDPFAWRILAIHNSERAAAGSAPLFWDPALAAGAAGWARYLAATGQFVHSDRKARRGIGENLAMGRRGYFGVDSLVRMWSAEKRNFMPGIYPATSRTGRWLDVVHYSQMIWPATTRVGCAVAAGRASEILVCRYAPAGNIDGRLVPGPRR